MRGLQQGCRENNNKENTNFQEEKKTNAGNTQSTTARYSDKDLH